MDIASEFAYRRVRPRLTGIAGFVLLAILALTLACVGVVVAIAVLLPVASDPVVVAPLRWR